MKIFPSTLLEAGREQSAAERRSRQLAPCRGGDSAFISWTQQLPSCAVAGRQKTPFHITDKNEMHICLIPEIKYPAYHFQSIQDSVNQN